MSLFSFFSSKNAAKPDWSPFSNADSFQLFMSIVESNVRPYNYQIDIDKGVINLALQEGYTAVVQLQNLAKKCLTVQPSEYERLIQASIGDLVLEFTKDASAGIPINEMIDEIGVRILPAYIFQKMADKSYLGFNITDDLFCFFVRDGQQTVVNISEQQIQELGIPLSQLFTIGRDNIRNKYPYKIALAQKRMYLIKADYYFAPNILLDIGQFPQLLGEYGSLVIVPCGATALVSPINDFAVTQDVFMLSAIADKYYSDESDPVSRNIYWYYNEEYTLIPFDHQKRNFDSLPQNFLRLLKTLEQV